jgi:dethiobiotin synthetase
MKPVSAGGREDAVELLSASGNSDDLDDVNPIALAEPLSPNLAAERSGTSIDVAHILDVYATLAERHDWMIVEGAGGLLVPLSDSCSIADLAKKIALPLIIVARAALGTINHTLLTIDAARARGLSVSGVIYNHVHPTTDGISEMASPEIVSRISGVPSLGRIPHLPNGSSDWAEQHLNMTAIVGGA